jgi:hypothetical protein
MESDMLELNPNHPVTREAHDLWHKIAALLVMREGGSVTIPESEITLIEGQAITVRFTDGVGIELNIVSMEEGERLAKAEGGLPH